MPPVINVAAAWAAGYMSAKVAAVAIGKWLLVKAVTVAAAYGIGRLVSRGANASGGLTSTGTPLDMRLDPLAPRRVIYGETSVGPVLRFRHVAGTNNKYLYLILVWAAHPCAGIVTLKADGNIVIFDGSGNALGTYAGVMRCTHHLGAHDQTADSNFVSEIGSVWTSNHKLQGCCYSAIRLEWNQDKFPTGVPQFTATIRGRMVYDEREGGHDPEDPSTWEWSDNPTLCLSDFVRGVPMLDGAGELIRPFGIGAAESRLPSARWIACANSCDEFTGKTAFNRTCDVESGNRHIGCDNVYGITAGLLVTGTGIPAGTRVVSVDGSGTFFTVDQDPTATNNGVTLTIGATEKRYTCNGCFDTDASPVAVLDQLAGSMAGKIVPIGVEFYPFAGVWMEPDFTVDETMLRGLPAASNPLPRRERINVVKGTFNNPAANHQRDDFPQVVSDAFIAEDGTELPRDLDLAFTNSASMAQRIAKIALLRSRQGIITSWPCNLRALPALTGENVDVDSTEFGWSGKPFELVEFTLGIERGDDGGLGFVPDLVMQETDSSIFDWSTDEEETKDPAPNTTLPDPRTVAAPTDLALTSGSSTVFIQEDGTAVPRLKLSWTMPADQSVQSGGEIQIQYKKNADSDWIDWTPVPGNQTFDFITDVIGGIAYDARNRAINSFNVASAWTTVTNHTIGGDTTAPSNPTGFSFVAGDAQSQDTPPPRWYIYTSNGHKVLMRAMTAKFTPSASKDVRFVEFVTATSAGAAEIIYGSNGPEFRVPGTANLVHVYKVGEDSSGTPEDLSATKLFVKCIDYSGNISSWTDLGLIDNYLKLPAGNSVLRNVGTSSGTVAAGDDSRVTGAAQKAANLSDLTNAGTARTNLGVTATGADTTYNHRSNNLSDVTNAGTARGNLGVTATGADTTYNYRANNLSDVANAATARNNLGVRDASHVVEFTGGSSSEAFTHTHNIGTVQQKILIECVDGFDIRARHNYGDAGNNTTTAVFVAFTWDGSDIPASSLSRFTIHYLP